MKKPAHPGLVRAIARKLRGGTPGALLKEVGGRNLIVHKGSHASPGGYDPPTPPMPVGTFIKPGVEVPAQVLGVGISALLHSSLTVGWSPAVLGGGAVVTYDVWRSDNGGAYAEVSHAQAGLTLGETGLTEGVLYAYKVRARNRATVVGEFSIPASDTTPYEVPATPDAPTIVDTSASDVDLSWPAVTVDSAVPCTYRIDRCTGSGCSDWSNHVILGAVTTWTDTINVDPDTTYRYRIKACNIAVCGEFSAASADATTDALALSVDDYTIFIEPLDGVEPDQRVDDLGPNAIVCYRGYDDSVNTIDFDWASGTMYFDGAAAARMVAVPHNLVLGGAWHSGSFFHLFKPEAGGANDYTVNFHNRHSTLYDYTTGVIEYFCNYKTGGDPRTGSQITCDIGAWQSICYAVSDGPGSGSLTRLKGYKNGVLATAPNSDAWIYNGSTSTDILSIGASNVYPTSVANGLEAWMGPVLWFNRGLSAAEVAIIHNYFAARFGLAIV